MLYKLPPKGFVDEVAEAIAHMDGITKSTIRISANTEYDENSIADEVTVTLQEGPRLAGNKYTIYLKNNVVALEGTNDQLQRVFIKLDNHCRKPATLVQAVNAAAELIGLVNTERAEKELRAAQTEIEKKNREDRMGRLADILSVDGYICQPRDGESVRDNFKVDVEEEYGESFQFYGHSEECVIHSEKRELLLHHAALGKKSIKKG